MNNLEQTMTRKEIVEFLKLNALEHSDHLNGNFNDGYNFLLDHLIDEFGDNSLKYNPESGFFDYVGTSGYDIP